MVNRLLLAIVMCITVVGSAIGQNIKGHFVSKTEDEGTIYHTFPCTLFEAAQIGGLTFDITYKSHSDGKAIINFTCQMDDTNAVDSVHFVSGQTQMKGAVKKIHISPQKKRWTHRYSFITDVEPLYTFFNVSTTPQVVVYGQGNAYTYKVKPAAWRAKAPVMHKIFEMVRINEVQ